MSTRTRCCTKSSRFVVVRYSIFGFSIREGQGPITFCQYRRISPRRSAQSAALFTGRPSWNCSSDFNRPKSLANSAGGVKQGPICFHAESESAAEICPNTAKPAQTIGKTTRRIEHFISRIIDLLIHGHLESNVPRIIGELERWTDGPPI